MLIRDVQHHQQKQPQTDNDNNELMTSLTHSGKTSTLNAGLLFARPISSDAMMSFTVSNIPHEKSCETISNIRQPVVLLTLGVMNLAINGDWALEFLTVSQVTNLFSFLDYQAQCRHPAPCPEPHQQHDNLLLHTEKELVFFVEEEKKSFVALVISTLLNTNDRRLERLFIFVRNIESYWISHFLLSQVMNEDKESDSHKICNASKIYGVSESYFRKLCHHAFTRGPKKQLRLWRAAHSALQLIEKDNSIATIAGNNGYASSSHFSSEIKSLFGITPREFKKLEGLLHE